MRPRLLTSWDRLRTSLWFVPALMLAAAAGLAFAMLSLDGDAPDGWLAHESWAYTGSADGARVVLGTIAGSMITIAGVVFSLTLVALTLASSNFGPRVLRNFMHDVTNQVVLGTFIATFLYCLLVLRAVRSSDADAFVPQLSVSVGVLLALASVGVLIHFIHHVAVSIQVDEVVTRVAAELSDGIERLFPEQLGEERDGEPGGRGAAGVPRGEVASEAALPSDFDARSGPIPAPTDGYLQLVDADLLMHVASREDLLVELVQRPGRYVVEGCPLARAYPVERLDPRVARRLADAFVLGARRTPVQDVEFCVVQLVEISLRALSPGVNEPFTAVACVDRLGAALSRLVRRPLPDPQRRDGRGVLRVVAHAVTFPEVLDAAFDQVRQAARRDASVTIRLLEALAVIAPEARRPEDRRALRDQAGMIVRGARQELPEPGDRDDVEERYERVQRLLGDA